MIELLFWVIILGFPVAVLVGIVWGIAAAFSSRAAKALDAVPEGGHGHGLHRLLHARHLFHNKNGGPHG